MKSIKLGSNVKSIGRSAFYSCTSLQSIELNEGLESIGRSAFSHCKALQEIVIPDNVTTLEGSEHYGSVFYGCTGLTKVVLGSGITTIETKMFYGCTSLKDVTIKEGCTEIGNSCFYECTSLEQIVLPASVASIGNYAFGNITGLRHITVKNLTPPSANVNVFTNEVYDEATLAVYESALDDYMAHPTWLKFFHISPTGIENVKYNGKTCNDIESVYTLNGQKTNSVKRGVRIVKMNNRISKKIYIK